MITPDGEIVLDFTPKPPALVNDGEMTWAGMPDPWLGPAVRLRVAPDPLGPVNKIIRLMRQDIVGSSKQIGPAKLYPVRQGSVVRLGQEDSPLTTIYDDEWAPLQRWGGRKVWYVEVDGKRVLEVPWGAALPEAPVRAPVSRRVRLQRWVRRQPRSVADRLVRRLGYVPEDEGDW